MKKCVFVVALPGLTNRELQSVSSIHSFILAMTIFPDVQKHAQAEIDAVIGSERLPSLGDKKNLPYLEALVKEVFRWNTVLPLGEVSGFSFIHTLLTDMCLSSPT